MSGQDTFSFFLSRLTVSSHLSTFLSARLLLPSPSGLFTLHLVFISQRCQPLYEPAVFSYRGGTGPDGTKRGPDPPPSPGDATFYQKLNESYLQLHPRISICFSHRGLNQSQQKLGGNSVLFFWMVQPPLIAIAADHQADRRYWRVDSVIV